MLVSILVNNFNYARFLGGAIDSALQQDYSNLEVIVVDDGSTDESRDIIASYGSRILPVLKDNGGQGSAFNAGFALAKGELICFLDADDLFLPNKVSSVVQAFKRIPNTSLIYHRLQQVDVHLKKIGGPSPRSVLIGDIRSKVERAGTWWPHPTTTGLCPSRWFLEKVLPLPAQKCRLCADGYIAGLAPFFGVVVGLEQPLGVYRMHDGNYWNFRGLTQREESQRRLERLKEEFDLVTTELMRHSSCDLSFSLEDNFRYQFHRFVAGLANSRLKVLSTVLTTQTLPFPMKWRELARIAMRYAKNAWRVT